MKLARRIDRSIAKAQKAFCQVEATIQHKGREYLVKSELSLTEEGEIRQASFVPLELDNITTPRNFKLIYLEPLDLEKSVRREKRVIGIRTHGRCGVLPSWHERQIGDQNGYY